MQSLLLLKLENDRGSPDGRRYPHWYYFYAMAQKAHCSRFECVTHFQNFTTHFIILYALHPLLTHFHFFITHFFFFTTHFFFFTKHFFFFTTHFQYLTITTHFHFLTTHFHFWVKQAGLHFVWLEMAPFLSYRIIMDLQDLFVFYLFGSFVGIDQPRSQVYFSLLYFFPLMKK